MFRSRRNCASCIGWRDPISSNLHVRSNVYISGHKDFRLKIRGRAAIRAYAERHNLALTDPGFTLQQTVELASEIPCAECNAFPEGVVLEDGRERLYFSCPTGQCESSPATATEFRIKLTLIKRGLDLLQNRVEGCHDIHGLLRMALAQTPQRRAPDDPNESYVAVYFRLTAVQRYLYGYLSLPQRSGVANAALSELIERKGRDV